MTALAYGRVLSSLVVLLFPACITLCHPSTGTLILRGRCFATVLRCLDDSFTTFARPGHEAEIRGEESDFRRRPVATWQLECRERFNTATLACQPTQKYITQHEYLSKSSRRSGIGWHGCRSDSAVQSLANLASAQLDNRIYLSALTGSSRAIQIPFFGSLADHIHRQCAFQNKF